MTGLDYVGVCPECERITAWMSGSQATPETVLEFAEAMTLSGRVVRRMALTDQIRDVLGSCPHHQGFRL